MIEICPAGPPKLMKPSLSQKPNASRKLIGAGLVSSSALFGEGVRLKRMLLVLGRFELVT